MAVNEVMWCQGGLVSRKLDVCTICADPLRYTQGGCEHNQVEMRTYNEGDSGQYSWREGGGGTLQHFRKGRGVQSAMNKWT